MSLLQYEMWSKRIENIEKRLLSLEKKPTVISKMVGYTPTDHGSLTGLRDDDHTQYLLTSGLREMTGHLGASPTVTYDLGTLGARFRYLRAKYLTSDATEFNVSQSMYVAPYIETPILFVDDILEQLTDAGVTIDGLKIKDSEPYCDVIKEKTLASGVTIDGMLIKDSQPNCDVIKEKTPATGVTVDDLLLKDGEIRFATGKTMVFHGTMDETFGVQCIKRDDPFDIISVYKDYPTCSVLGSFKTNYLFFGAGMASSNVTRLATNSSNDAYFIFTTWKDTWNDILYMTYNKIGIYDDMYFFLPKDSDGSLPTASSSYRGVIIRTEGASGTADKLYCCMKGTDDNYSWVQVAIG